MAKKGAFGSFSKKTKGANSFGSFSTTEEFKPANGVTPIRTEFSKGSLPDSIYSSNREAAWSRWRRGYEIYTNSLYGQQYSYPFNYLIPLPPGTVIPPGSNPPQIPGICQGFPTKNKELGMHWAGARVAGSLRFDNVRDSGGNPSPIASVRETEDFFFITLAGNWSAANPLPAPLYIRPIIIGGQVVVPEQYPINGEILEDRIIEVGGTPIDREAIDPTTNTRYGYVQAVLLETNEKTGELKLQKLGSVEATPDAVLQTPSRSNFHVGRFLMTGSRYCCSCQDFSRRDYYYLSNLNTPNNRKMFPRTNVATIKPGRFEIMKGKPGDPNAVNNSAMTSATLDRQMTVVSPDAEYNIPPTVTPNSDTVPGTTRDNPGVFRDFGKSYVRNNPLPSIEGAVAEGPPLYEDYNTVQNADGSYTITSLTDFWTPLLDEMRYCKHIYAMKFAENTFPPEPSDLPVEMGSIAEWEENLVAKTEKDNREAMYNLANRGLETMDIPPYNCQSPMMMPMFQKLFNVPSTFILMENFRMVDKTGKEYNPSEGERPST
jgi:hypothetical protein